MKDRPELKEDKQDHFLFPTQRLHSYSHEPLFNLVIILGGVVVFFVWTLPHIVPLMPPHTTILTYVTIFAPPFCIVPALLIGSMIWQARIGHGKKESMEISRQRKGISQLSLQERKKSVFWRKGNAEAVQAMLAMRHRPHIRNTGVNTLLQRRKERFYQGRVYKGKAHQTALLQLNPLASQSVPLSLVASDEGATSAMAEEELTPTSDRSESEDMQRKPVKSDYALQYSALVLQSEDRESNESEWASLDIEENVEPREKTPVTIYLLKEVRVDVENAEGHKRSIQLKRKRRDDGKYTERELLAYIASYRGRSVAREKLLEHVFAYGLSDERYSLTNLTNQFNKCTQFLRQDINKVAGELGIPALTIISSARDEWHLLTEECRVVDLDEIERLYKLVDEAIGEDCLQPSVQTACQRLIDAYTGDFLENYIEDAVREGGDNWVDNWIRQPYTEYRTKYFQALWYRAEYWRIKASMASDTSSAERTLQRKLYEQAAKLYQKYALQATTDFTNQSAMLFDLEIKQRTSQAERALLASLDMYTATKNTQAGDMLYLTFARRMEALTNGQWQPHADIVEALEKLREQTQSYRLAPYMRSHDLSTDDE